MSTPKEALTTPTTSKEDIRKADSYVFSSPARDVGWSPGAAHTPLNVSFCGNKSTSTYVNHMLSHLSPIRRTSRFPLSHIDKDVFEITASSHHNPTAEVKAREVNLTSKSHHDYEPSKEARASKLLPPPSTPQPLGALFHSPLPKYSTDYYMGYPYGENKIYDETQSQSRENSSQINVGDADQSNIHKTGIPLTCLSSPISPPCYITSDSPVKSRRVPTFPPPASPPPFTGYTPSFQHTYRNSEPERVVGLGDRRLERTSPRSRVLSPSSLSYPSAEPLDDDPFLVRAATTTNARVLGGSTLRYRLDPLESTEVIHSMGAASSSVGYQSYPIQADSSRRTRIPRGRMGALDSRTGGAKNPTSQSKAAPRQRRGVVIDESDPLSIISPSPHAPAQSSSFSFSYPYKPESQSQSSSGTSAFGYVSNDGYLNPSAPLTRLEIATSSYANPISMAGTLFPTPSLTSSLGTPSTASIVLTPGHPTLFPSPDIISSPTIMRSTRSRNEVAHGQLMSRFATLTPTAEPDLIGEGNLAERTPEYQNFHHTRVKTRLGQNAQNQGSNMSGLDEGKVPIQTDTSPDGYASENAGHCVDSELSQTSSSDSLVGQSSISPCPPVEYEGHAQTPSICSIQESPTQHIFIDQLSKGMEDPINKSPQSKRVRDENDTVWTPVITKRTKVLDERNASPSPAREGNLKRISDVFGLGRATRSRTRAASALFALSSSGNDSGFKGNQTGSIGGQEHLEDEIRETKTLITRYTSTRSKHQPQPTIGNYYNTPIQSQKTRKYSMVGRAPSRAVDVPSSNIVKTQSSISTHAEAWKDSGITQRLSQDSQLNECPQTYDGEIEAGSVDQSQEANHVSAPKEKPEVPSELLPRPDHSVIYGPDGKIVRRTFPEDLPIHESYPKWYRRNPISAYFSSEDPARSFIFGESVVSVEVANPVPRLVFNSAPHFSLYVPRFVRGVSAKKVGLCPICVEPVWRGGEGRNMVLNTKISQYNYHMQYYHGISPKTGLPFSPPIAFRKTKRKKSQVKALEREVVEQGKCHVCKNWIILESLKLMDIMIPERLWWKHAASCHGINRLAGDKNPYIEDNVYLKLCEYEVQLKNNAGLTEKLRSEDQIASPDAPGAVASVVQTDETGAPGNAWITQGERLSLDGQGPSMDWESDLTDLDEEAGVADVDTSDYEA